MKYFKRKIFALIGHIHKLREKGFSDEEIRKDPLVDAMLGQIVTEAFKICDKADENRKKIAESDS